MIIQKPVITEKSLRDAQSGIFTFAVDKDATKDIIKKEIATLYAVHPKRVTTAIRKGKVKFVGRKRNRIQREHIKIARVKLQKGEKIDFFEIGRTK